MNAKPLTIVSLIGILGLTLTACDGWNAVTEGENGLVDFTPTHCGRDNHCDLDDDIAAGSQLRVHIDEADSGISVFGLELVSSNPWVFDVVPVDGRSDEWLVLANNPGTADLVAIDGWGVEVDYTFVYVAAPTTVAVHSARGVRREASGYLGFDHAYWLTADTIASFRLRPEQLGFELMGDVRYDVVMDEGLAAAILPGSDIASGTFSVGAATGEYAVRFTAPSGATTNLLFIVED